jgi:integrase
MAKGRPTWLADLSSGFKRHRQGRPGWMVEVSRDRLRVVSAELPPRPGETADAPPKRRAVTLSTPPGPATFKDALSEACGVFDAVMAGQWRWPEPGAPPIGEDPQRLSPVRLQPLIERLKTALIGEQISETTWDRTYRLYFARLLELAEQRHWPTDRELLEMLMRQWPANSRARQMAHDRCRRLWKEAGWSWPDGLAELRGNGKAAADPKGVRAFTGEELEELRARLQRSNRLTPADLVAWDCLICFGLRPAELQGLELSQEQGLPVAHVTRQKRSSKGVSGARQAPAVPPTGWPADCFGLVSRWLEHGLPAGMVAARSPAETLGQQLTRLRQQQQVKMPLDSELTPYGCRHAYALRLAQQLGLHVRESAELMGHSPAVHLSTYGRRLETPKLLAKVRDQVMQTSRKVSQSDAD